MPKETCGSGQQGYDCGISERLAKVEGGDEILVVIALLTLVIGALGLRSLQKRKSGEVDTPQVSNEERSKNPDEDIFG